MNIETQTEGDFPQYIYLLINVEYSYERIEFIAFSKEEFINHITNYLYEEDIDDLKKVSYENSLDKNTEISYECYRYPFKSNMSLSIYYTYDPGDSRNYIPNNFYKRDRVRLFLNQEGNDLLVGG